MQQITIDAIERKEFKWKTRGYDPEEVDNFLDDICDEMQRQQETIQKLQQQLKDARMTRPEAAPAAAPAPAAESGVNDDAVKEMLAMAVRLKNETVAEAQKKAEEIVAKAEEQAKERLGSLSAEHERLTEQVTVMKQAAAEYRAKFAELVKNQQELMDKASELF